ncbi:Ser-Thr-rich GPI-anchored membrane family protein, partial [Planctomycetota bacterium]
MSKKISQVPAEIKISKRRINVKMLFLTAVVIMMVSVSAQGQLPGGHEISGYVTYGTTGLSNVLITAVGNGDFTGYLALNMTNYQGYYDIPVPDGFSGYVEASKSGYTFDPASRNYSNVQSDQTNQNFAASNGDPPPPPPSIIVETPNGGESWQRGTSHNITWNSFGGVGSDVKIELFKDGVLNLKITSSTSNDGSFIWSVPSNQTIGSDYRIEITSTDNSSYYDDSDNNFSIAGQSIITVTSPNGGENWQRGTSQNIAWDSVGDVGSDVRIELYKGEALNLKIISSTANNGSYDWSIPPDQAIDSDYMIKITSA